MKILKKILKSKVQKIRKPYGYDITPAIQDFQKNITAIRAEWKNYVTESSSSGKPIDEISELQKELNQDKKWKACFLYVFGKLNNSTQSHFPKTIEIIKRNKRSLNLVFFSSLEPGKHIQPHTGNNHGVIRTQFGIDIQEPDKTGLRVDDKLVQLKNLEMFTFDDTYEHEAWNKGEAIRTVLIIDSYKKLPFFYSLLNKYHVKKMKESEHVQSVLKKMDEHE